MSKTIKQLADELGVSKTAIRKYMTEDFRAAHTAIIAGNIIEISNDGCELIAVSLRKPSKTPENRVAETPETQDFSAEIAFLREQLTAKDEQLAAKDRQIDALTTALANTTSALNLANESLHAAQALHAGTIQQQLESHGEDVQVVQEEHEQPRRWWQFWK